MKNKKLWSLRIDLAVPLAASETYTIHVHLDQDIQFINNIFNYITNNLIIRCKQNIRLPLTVNEDKNR